MDSTLCLVGLYHTLRTGRWCLDDMREARRRLEPFIPEDHKTELAALAESVGETIVVFLPSTAHSKLATWKPEVQYLHDKLEAGEPVTGDWVKEVVADKLGYFLFNLLEDEDLTDAQRQAIVNDFNRSMKLIKIGGSWELDPDRGTIAYGAVTGILNGMNLLGI